MPRIRSQVDGQERPFAIPPAMCLMCGERMPQSQVTAHACAMKTEKKLLSTREEIARLQAKIQNRKKSRSEEMHRVSNVKLHVQGVHSTANQE